MLSFLKSTYRSFRKSIRLMQYQLSGKKAWTTGYDDFKWNQINASIQDPSFLSEIDAGRLPSGYGKKIDDRIVEYPWIFAQLKNSGKKILDAGSTFNYPILVSNALLQEKDLTIFTFYPEINNYSSKRISYVYGDLLDMPFRNELFDTIICQSTLEHIDMDNSIYGYDLERRDTTQEKSYSFLKGISELLRVLKSGGMMCITFPYGKFENHGFFQQLDSEMVSRIRTVLEPAGKIMKERYFLYKPEGWIVSNSEEANEAESYNPHTGKGKGTDDAAHCRSLCCIAFSKN